MPSSGRPVLFALLGLTVVPSWAVLTACTNVPEKQFASVGGTRRATGTVATSTDTGDTASTVDTAEGDGVPVLEDAWYLFGDEVDGKAPLTIHVRFTDSSNDVEGGTISYTLDDVAATRDILSSAAIESIDTQAQLDGDEISFGLGTQDPNGTFLIDAIQLRDVAGNQSNEKTVAIPE